MRQYPGAWGRFFCGSSGHLCVSEGREGTDSGIPPHSSGQPPGNRGQEVGFCVDTDFAPESFRSRRYRCLYLCNRGDAGHSPALFVVPCLFYLAG